VVPVIQRHDAAPAEALRDGNRGDQHDRQDAGPRMIVDFPQVVKEERDLAREGYFGDGGGAPAEEDGRENRVPEAVPLEVDAGQERPVGAGEDVYSREHQVVALVGMAVAAPRPVVVEGPGFAKRAIAV